MNDPDRIEYLTENGAVANRFPFPLGVRFVDAFPLAQTLLRTYWRFSAGRLWQMHKGSDYPHTVRVLTQRGEVVCQWSKDDERLAA
jgi:hypothetical protein